MKPVRRFSENFGGRLRVIERLRLGKLRSLSIGSSITRLSALNVDISVECGPDIVADVLHLPFVSGAFDEILFTDVIEHLQPNSERGALIEIHRILSDGGRLLISTPNDRNIFEILDPAYWILGHRHYSPNDVADLLESSGFRIETLFTSGGIFAMLGVVWYSFVSWPSKRIFGSNLRYSPPVLRKRENAEYLYRTPKEGYTVFAIARRK